jgi:hypothetical protein
MATNHDRRLGRLEEISAPKGRTVFIWDNHKPGCVEREKARLIGSGSVKPHDQYCILRWLKPDDAGL